MAREYWLDKPEEFYVYDAWEKRFRQTPAEPVQVAGLGECDLFMVDYGPLGATGFSVAHGPSGTRIGLGSLSPTKDGAMSDAIEWAKERGRDLRFLTDQAVKFWGLSPRYKWEDE